ncbi:S-layer homology domain-containing protein [Anoxynatronum buryatiense]|uniref:S-layer homology domain-containing protein n=1 Tax=Anoxynatronum buryatiense TaxID=489973 RepID=A0AA46AHI7_9CLOT|nr:S-layer homology domain-containing protein [Anoxynatronum buryatiense]SMP40089.1 S-layer homology domain-containing protein [Anoxynatronum buryatiense]
MTDMMNGKCRWMTWLLVLLLLFSPLTTFALDKQDYAVEISGSGVAEVLQLSIDDLKAMPAEAQINEAYVYNSRAGEKTAAVKGVSLAYVLTEAAGVTAVTGTVSFTASDGYPIEPQPLEDVLDAALQYVLAYEVDGVMIDEDDNPETQEIIVYRKVKETGEFGTVFKMIERIEVDGALAVSENEEAAETEAAEETEDETPEMELEESGDESPAISFTDITPTFAYATTAIEGLVNQGVISGMGDGRFAPAESLTRAQIATIMVKALGHEPTTYRGGFSDVKESDWFASHVQAAVDAGIFSGYPDGTFKPDQVISRQELAVVTGKAAVENGVVEQQRMAKFVMEKSDYADKEAVPAWAAHQVAWLEAQGVFQDFIGEDFEPARTVNRAEAATVIFKTLY